MRRTHTSGAAIKGFQLVVFCDLGEYQSTNGESCGGDFSSPRSGRTIKKDLTTVLIWIFSEDALGELAACNVV